MKKHYITRVSKKIVRFLIAVLFLSFLALPFIGKVSDEVPSLFLENNFDISNVSTNSQINEIYEISILESAVEPEVIYLYSGDVLKFLNTNAQDVSLNYNEDSITILSHREYFKVFSEPETYFYKVLTLNNEVIGSLTVHVK